jgi:hypothetical protein
MTKVNTPVPVARRQVQPLVRRLATIRRNLYLLLTNIGILRCLHQFQIPLNWRPFAVSMASARLPSSGPLPAGMLGLTAIWTYLSPSLSESVYFGWLPFNANSQISSGGKLTSKQKPL